MLLLECFFDSFGSLLRWSVWGEVYFGQEGSRQFFMVEQLPVYGFKEGVRFDFGDAFKSESIFWSALDEPVNEVNAVAAPSFRHAGQLHLR